MAADHLASDSLLQLPRIWTAPMAAPTDIGASVCPDEPYRNHLQRATSKPFRNHLHWRRKTAAIGAYCTQRADRGTAGSSLKNELLQRFAQTLGCSQALLSELRTSRADTQARAHHQLSLIHI